MKYQDTYEYVMDNFQAMPVKSIFSNNESFSIEKEFESCRRKTSTDTAFYLKLLKSITYHCEEDAVWDFLGQATNLNEIKINSFLFLDLLSTVSNILWVGTVNTRSNINDQALANFEILMNEIVSIGWSELSDIYKTFLFRSHCLNPVLHDKLLKFSVEFGLSNQDLDSIRDKTTKNLDYIGDYIVREHLYGDSEYDYLVSNKEHSSRLFYNAFLRGDFEYISSTSNLSKAEKMAYFDEFEEFSIPFVAESFLKFSCLMEDLWKDRDKKSLKFIIDRLDSTWIVDDMCSTLYGIERESWFIDVIFKETYEKRSSKVEFKDLDNVFIALGRLLKDYERYFKVRDFYLDDDSVLKALLSYVAIDKFSKFNTDFKLSEASIDPRESQSLKLILDKGGVESIEFIEMMDSVYKDYMNQFHITPTYWHTNESDSEIALTNIAKKHEVIFNTRQEEYYEKLTETVKDFVKFLDSELGRESGANDDTIEVIIDFLLLIGTPYMNSEDDIILLFQHYHSKEDREVHVF